MRQRKPPPPVFAIYYPRGAVEGEAETASPMHAAPEVPSPPPSPPPNPVPSSTADAAAEVLAAPLPSARGPEPPTAPPPPAESMAALSLSDPVPPLPAMPGPVPILATPEPAQEPATRIPTEPEPLAETAAEPDRSADPAHGTADTETAVPTEAPVAAQVAPATEGREPRPPLPPVSSAAPQGVGRPPAPEEPPSSAPSAAVSGSMPQFRMPEASPAFTAKASSADGAIAHEVLGLFAPDVLNLSARVGDGGWAGLGKPRAGLYRPEGFRPAPWNGLSYDVAPADGRGLGAGTRVLTARGEVPVEQLVPHDRVLGLRGPRLAEVTWIGRRSLPPARGDAAPVRVPADALGDGQPAQDVIVGPDQTLFPDGASPVPARELVRTGVATRVEGRETEMFQVALRPYPGAEAGDVLLVEGIFAASRSNAAAAVAAP